MRQCPKASRPPTRADLTKLRAGRGAQGSSTQSEAAELGSAGPRSQEGRGLSPQRPHPRRLRGELPGASGPECRGGNSAGRLRPPQFAPRGIWAARAGQAPESPAFSGANSRQWPRPPLWRGAIFRVASPERSGRSSGTSAPIPAAPAEASLGKGHVSGSFAATARATRTAPRWADQRVVAEPAAVTRASVPGFRGSIHLAPRAALEDFCGLSAGPRQRSFAGGPWS